MEFVLKQVNQLLGGLSLRELGETLSSAAERLSGGAPVVIMAIEQKGLTPYPSPAFPSHLVDRCKELVLKERYLSRVQSGVTMEIGAKDWPGLLPVGIRKVILAPLTRQGRQYGLMIFLEARRILKQDMRQIKLLADVACLATDSITSASLVQTRLYKISLLQEVSHSLTVSLSLDEIGRAAVESVIKLSGADGARIWTSSPRGNPKPLVALGAVWEGPESKEGWDWRKVRRALRKRINDTRTVVVNDARSKVDDAIAPLVGPFLSWASFPLIPYDKPIGMIELFCRRPFGFPPDDELLIGIFAEALAFTMQNAMLYGQITEQRDQITLMKDYVEGIIKDITDGIIVIDENDRIRILNPEARTLLGVKGKRVVGVEFKTVLPHELVSKIIEMRSNPFNRDAMVEFDLVSEDKGNRLIPLGLRHTPLKGSESEGDQLFVIQDLSGVREIESLRELDRLKSQFISALGHELRTPLTSIQGFISTLNQASEDEFDAATRGDFYSIIESECLSLTRLIDNLLHVSRIDAGETLAMNPKPFDLAGTIQRVVNNRKSPSDQHTIRLNVQPDKGVVNADEALIEHVLANLFTNAIKYSPPKSLVTISVADQGDMVRVTVDDQGPGIEPKERKKIFRQFYRIQNPLTASKGGAGVGLFLSRYLVRMHGGEIGVEPAEGGGSRFFFTLPKAQGRKI